MPFDCIFRRGINGISGVVYDPGEMSVWECKAISGKFVCDKCMTYSFKNEGFVKSKMKLSIFKNYFVKNTNIHLFPIT